MDQIINWLLLVIIFVFDPLAIALVIAANFAFAQLKKENNKTPEIKTVEKIVEKIVEVPVEVEKTVYGEEVEKKLELFKHPKIQNTIKHMRRNGDL